MFEQNFRSPLKMKTLQIVKKNIQQQTALKGNKRTDKCLKEKKEKKRKMS